MNYYQILGLSVRASQEEVKAAYKSFCQKCHPDKGGSEEFFREGKKAYEVLSDPFKRSVYDQGVENNFNYEEIEHLISSYIEGIITTYCSTLGEGGERNPKSAINFMIAARQKEVKQSLKTRHRKQEALRKTIKRTKVQGKKSMIYEALEQQMEQMNSIVVTLKMQLAVLDILQKDVDLLLYEEGVEDYQSRIFTIADLEAIMKP